MKDKYNAQELISVFTVNGVLGCELYLKTILYITKNKFLHTHDIEVLYNSLNRVDKDFILDNMKQDSYYIDSNVFYNINEFNNDLANSKNYFVEFRYLFEKQGQVVCVDFFKFFSTGLT